MAGDVTYWVVWYEPTIDREHARFPARVWTGSPTLGEGTLSIEVTRTTVLCGQMYIVQRQCDPPWEGLGPLYYNGSSMVTYGDTIHLTLSGA